MQISTYNDLFHKFFSGGQIAISNWILTEKIYGNRFPVVL